MTAVERVTQTLINEGGKPGHSLHSWRCEYPDRYGKCTCVEETAKIILADLADDDAVVELVAIAIVRFIALDQSHDTRDFAREILCALAEGDES